MAKKKAAKKVKAPKGKKDSRANKTKKVKGFEVTENGNPTKLWCQFAATQDTKMRILKGKGIRGHKTLGDYAQALILEDLKKLGSKVK